MEQQQETSSDKQTEERRSPLFRPTDNQLRAARAQLLAWASAAAKAGALAMEARLLRAADELRQVEQEMEQAPTAAVQKE